jgi:hypothetical protein
MIARADEHLPGQPLLRTVMRNGAVIASPRDLVDIRRETKAAIESLPRNLRALAPTKTAYCVDVSAALQGDEQDVIRKVKSQT